MLHLIRSAPEAATSELIEAMTQSDADCVIHLYEKAPDWDRIIETIFQHDKIICWW